LFAPALPTIFQPVHETAARLGLAGPTDLTGPFRSTTLVAALPAAATRPGSQAKVGEQGTEHHDSEAGNPEGNQRDDRATEQDRDTTEEDDDAQGGATTTGTTAGGAAKRGRKLRVLGIERLLHLLQQTLLMLG